ncbi:hypothetical protein DUI70_6889 [Streptomyces albus]|uniref:hypothetical protein n=1 Tax=Streptomyces physcomitrii TaxID=2724184 RepID=UPI000696CCB9|nr:hypothetical protein SLNHY_7001 [Streptomyces albus]AYN37382.1 hypothetical protein DUI70_6889 [Streptomyces albus]
MSDLYVRRLTLAAFHELHHDAYGAYAFARIADWGQARQCVEDAFEVLRTQWRAALCSERPAAYSWEVLRERISLQQPWPIPQGCSPFPDAQLDVLLLHRLLLFPLDRTAALMGIEDHAAQALLRGAERALSGLPAQVAPAWWRGPTLARGRAGAYSGAHTRPLT